MKIYRVYVLGKAPSDLKERIALMHADSILKGKGQDVSLPNRDLGARKEKAPKSKTIKSKNNG